MFTGRHCHDKQAYMYLRYAQCSVPKVVVIAFSFVEKGWGTPMVMDRLFKVFFKYFFH